MKTRATRRTEYTATAPTTPCLYVAFELGIDEWKLGFATELGGTAQVRRMPARDCERLQREIADAKTRVGVTSATPVRSCYEAGRDGFWLHRYLASLGIENAVVDSSNIEVNRRLRRAKSDRLDALGITFNQGVLGSIPRRLTNLRGHPGESSPRQSHLTPPDGVAQPRLMP